MAVKPELIVRWSGGELNLMGWNDSPFGKFRIELLANGSSWVSPEAQRRVLRSALSDGSRSVKERDNNRKIPLRFAVTGPDASALAAGEAALAGIDGRSCELVWTPPINLGVAASVYVVDSVDLSYETNDLAEKRRERIYGLTFDCLPHVYSDEWITVTAQQGATSTPVVINDGSALTGWTVTGGSLQVVSGKVVATGDGTSTTVEATLTETVDFSAHRYLAAVVTHATGREFYAEINVGGVWSALPLVRVADGAWVYDTASVVAAGLRLVFATRHGSALSGSGSSGSALSGALLAVGEMGRIDQLRKQASVKATATREMTMTATFPGARRTPTSLHVASPSEGLGTVLVYSGPGYDPAIGWRSNGARGTAASPVLVSGGFDNLVTGTSYQASWSGPASAFPAGEYVLWMRGDSSTTSDSLVVEVGVAPPGVTPEFKTVATAIAPYEWVPNAATITDAMALLLLGSTALPGVDLPDGSNAVLTVRVTADDAIAVDEIWLCNTTLGSVTIVQAGTDQDVWLDAPTMERDHPAVFCGTAVKEGAMPKSLLTELPAWGGAHAATVPVTYLHVMATGADDFGVTFFGRAAWHTHPPVSLP